MIVFDHLDLRVRADPSGGRPHRRRRAGPEYTEPYYASFFEDPDGNRLDVVCR